MVPAPKFPSISPFNGGGGGFAPTPKLGECNTIQLEIENFIDMYICRNADFASKFPHLNIFNPNSIKEIKSLMMLASKHTFDILSIYNTQENIAFLQQQLETAKATIDSKENEISKLKKEYKNLDAAKLKEELEQEKRSHKADIEYLENQHKEALENEKAISDKYWKWYREATSNKYGLKTNDGFWEAEYLLESSTRENIIEHIFQVWDKFKHIPFNLFENSYNWLYQLPPKYRPSSGTNRSRDGKTVINWLLCQEGIKEDLYLYLYFFFPNSIEFKENEKLQKEIISYYVKMNPLVEIYNLFVSNDYYLLLNYRKENKVNLNKYRFDLPIPGFDKELFLKVLENAKPKRYKDWATRFFESWLNSENLNDIDKTIELVEDDIIKKYGGLGNLRESTYDLHKSRIRRINKRIYEKIVQNIKEKINDKKETDSDL